VSHSLGSRTSEVDEGLRHKGRRWKKSPEGDILLWDKRRARWKPWRAGSGPLPPPELLGERPAAVSSEERPRSVFPDASQPSPWFSASKPGRDQDGPFSSRRWIVWLVALIAGAAIGGAITYSLVQADLRAGARSENEVALELARTEERVGELERELARREADAGWQDIKVWSGYGSLTTEPVKIPRGRVRIAYSFFGTDATRGQIGLHAPNQDYLRTILDEPGTFTGVTPIHYAGPLSLQVDGAEWVVRLQRFQ
jgi:hypothetical protein